VHRGVKQVVRGALEGRQHQHAVLHARNAEARDAQHLPLCDFNDEGLGFTDVDMQQCDTTAVGTEARGRMRHRLLAHPEQKDGDLMPGHSRRTLYVMQSASSIMCRVSMDMPCPDMVALIWSTILARAASMPCSMSWQQKRLPQGTTGSR
jgi:hypothetical protein